MTRTCVPSGLRGSTLRAGWILVPFALLPIAATRGSESRDHADGPPPAHTGGFGEPSCFVCHDGLTRNDPSGELRLHGLGEPFEPGVPRVVTFVLAGYEMERAGFQAAFRVAGGESAGANAGRLEPLDERTTVAHGTEGNVEYIQHTRAGTVLENEMTQWSFFWIPPEGVETVVLHVAANSANGDDSPLGDIVYTASVELRRR